MSSGSSRVLVLVSGALRALPGQLVLAALVAAALTATWAAVSPFGPAHLYNDTFQHISVARNLAAGNGLATSVIYYDEQYATGLVPAPQTVWPPGLPIAIWSLSWLGVDLPWAAMWLSVAALLACVPMLLAIARRLGLDSARAALVALTPLAVAANGWVAWRGGSEPPYTLFALASLLYIAKAAAPQHARRDVALAALMLVGGAAVRNHGVFLAATAVAFFGYEAMRARSVQVARTGLVVILPVTGFYAWLFVRNLLLAGSLTGGTAASAWADLPALAHAMGSALVSLIGIGTQTPARAALTCLVAAMIGACVARTAWRALVSADSRATEPVTDAARRIVVFCLLHLAITIGGLALWAAQRSPEMFLARYLLPLVPFIALACFGVSARHSAGHNGGARSRGALVASALIAILATAHSTAFVREARAWSGDAGVLNLLRSLEAQVAGRPFLEFVQRESVPARPILSSSSQVLAGWVDAPVLGLAPRPYSALDWGADEVRAMTLERRVSYVVVHAADTDGGGNAGRTFFREVRAGKVPAWLRLVESGSQLTVYEVVGNEAGADL